MTCEVAIRYESMKFEMFIVLAVLNHVGIPVLTYTLDKMISAKAEMLLVLGMGQELMIAHTNM